MAVRSISGGYFLASIFSAHNLKRKERKWNKFLFVRDKPGSGWMSDVRTFVCFLFFFSFFFLSNPGNPFEDGASKEETKVKGGLGWGPRPIGLLF